MLYQAEYENKWVFDSLAFNIIASWYIARWGTDARVCEQKLMMEWRFCQSWANVHLIHIMWVSELVVDRWNLHFGKLLDNCLCLMFHAATDVGSAGLVVRCFYNKN